MYLWLMLLLVIVLLGVFPQVRLVFLENILCSTEHDFYGPGALTSGQPTVTKYYRLILAT